MTIRLTLVETTDLPKDVVGLFVEGSQAGPLVSKQPPKGFNIMVSLKSVLLINVFHTQFKQKIGQTTFSPLRFVRENKYDRKLHEGQDILYVTNIFDKYQKPCGQLSFSVRYYPDHLYVGEKIGLFESLPQRQPLTISKDAVHKKNIFNCLDAGYSKTPFELVEKPYRDEQFQS